MTSTPSVAPPHLAFTIPPNRCQKYEQIAMTVVKRTVDQYIDRIHTGDAMDHRLNSTNWKLLKKRECLRIYKSRKKIRPSERPTSPGDLSAGKIASDPMAQWAPHSRLLCIGTLPGTLDEAMLGAITPTERAMATRSLSINDEYLQHHVLQDIKVPTKEEPYDYVGLKWALRSSPLRAIVSLRDVVYVEASGFLDMSINGELERVGYTVCHSVEIPELEPATTKHVVRARLSLCSVFRQKAPGIVDVFVALESDPGGKLSSKMAALSAASALQAAAKVMDCSLDRKLAWLHHQEIGSHQSHVSCVRCARDLSTFASLAQCGVCRLAVCPRCVVTRKLVVGTIPKRKSFQICAGCIESARRDVNTNHVATEEVAQIYTPIGASQDTTESTNVPAEIADFTKVHPVPEVADFTIPLASMPRRGSRSPQADPIVLYEEPEAVDFRATKPLQLEDLAGPERDRTPSQQDDGPLEHVRSLSPQEVERLVMLKQMNALWLQAEHTFNMTKRQTRTLQRSKVEVDFSKSAIY